MDPDDRDDAPVPVPVPYVPQAPFTDFCALGGQWHPQFFAFPRAGGIQPPTETSREGLNVGSRLLLGSGYLAYWAQGRDFIGGVRDEGRDLSGQG